VALIAAIIAVTLAGLALTAGPLAEAATLGDQSTEQGSPATQNLPAGAQQEAVLREATKLSLGCRIFRNLYDRWPVDVAEIRAKVEGINFSVFPGLVSVRPQSDDSEIITVYDGVVTRAVKATPVAFQISDAQRAAAKAPGFKIKL
jgi:hypothetical protein